MTTPALSRFYRAGILALDPSAFGCEFPATPAAVEPFTRCGPLAVVEISGPLTHGGPLWDSYAQICNRVALALASDATIVVLRTDSPGGDVFGCFDAARKLRALATAAGKPLVAFTEARMQSAAYALSSAASEIVVSEVASVGSIGVIVAHADVSAADAAMGVRFEVFTSGERKADGNPHVPMSDAARASIQSAIDETAGVFFALVKDHRQGFDARHHEGRSWIGASAVEAGAADRIESWDSMVARLSSVGVGAISKESASAHSQDSMADSDKDKDADRAALAKAAAAGNKRAQKALKAYDDEADEKAESEDDKPKGEDKSPPAKDDDKEASDDADKKEASAAAGAFAAQAAAAEARAKAAEAKLAARDRADAFSALQASRTDISATVWATLEPLTLDVAKAIVAAIPPAAAGGNTLAPPSNLPAIPGARTPKDRPTVADMDPTIARAMGLLPPELPVSDGVIHYMGQAPDQVTK